jgi:hypothetical protein
MASACHSFLPVPRGSRFACYFCDCGDLAFNNSLLLLIKDGVKARSHSSISFSDPSELQNISGFLSSIQTSKIDRDIVFYFCSRFFSGITKACGVIVATGLRGHRVSATTWRLPQSMGNKVSATCQDSAASEAIEILVGGGS